MDSDRLVLAALAGTGIIGGCNVVFAKISLSELQPFWGAAIRFLAATLLFFLMVAVRRSPIPRGKALVGALAYGILNFGASYALVYYALPSVNAGFVSVIASLMPIATLFLATAHGQERIGIRGIVGGVVAVGGTLVIFYQQLALAIPLAAFLALLGFVVCMAETSIILKQFPGGDPYATNGVAMLVGTSILFGLSASVHERWGLPTQPATIFSLVYLVTIGSVLSYALYLFVIAKWSASATNYSSVISPPVTVALASALTGESFSLVFLAGMALVLVGVYVGAVSVRRK